MSSRLRAVVLLSGGLDSATTLGIARGIPATYVPARNTIFLSFALAWAETLGADDIFIGVNVLDASGYPDCRPEYIEAYPDDEGGDRADGDGGRRPARTHVDMLRAAAGRRGLRALRRVSAPPPRLRRRGSRRPAPLRA